MTAADRSALPSPAALDRAVTYLATTRTDEPVAGRWAPITCEEREALVCRNGERYDGFKVASALTDTDGQYGDPTIFTEWYDALTGSEESVLRDYRYPGRRTPDDPYPRDARPCEHYRWATA